MTHSLNHSLTEWLKDSITEGLTYSMTSSLTHNIFDVTLVSDDDQYIGAHSFRVDHWLVNKSEITTTKRGKLAVLIKLWVSGWSVHQSEINTTTRGKLAEVLIKLWVSSKSVHQSEITTTTREKVSTSSSLPLSEQYVWWSVWDDQNYQRRVSTSPDKALSEW